MRTDWPPGPGPAPAPVVCIGSTSICVSAGCYAGSSAGKRYYNGLAIRCADQRFLIGRGRACAVQTSGSRGVWVQSACGVRSTWSDSIYKIHVVVVELP